MRFSSLLALIAPIAMLSSASAAGLLNNIPRTTLTKRVGVELPVCASVAVDVNLRGLLGLPVEVNLGDLCLCATAGLLTDNSVTNIATAIGTGGGLLGALANSVGAIVDILEPVSLGLLNNTQSTTCSSTDPNVVPSASGAQCNDCTYSCKDGYEYCNNVCVVTGSPCATSGLRKRSVKERSRYACPQPLTACPVSHFLARETAATYGGGFECIDTTSNLESCGGCATPFKGSTAGEDCTAIANVDSISCISGRCIVDSCAPGFVPSADSSACEKASRFGSSRLMVQSRRSRK